MILPIIDLLTSLMTRYMATNLTLGTIIKGLMVIYFGIYILFLTNSKRKKFLRNYILLILAYIVLYFLFKPKLLTEGFVISELAYMMKVFFLPILFGGYICFFDDSGFSNTKMNKVLFVNLILYVILLIIPFITNTAFDTYIDRSKGSVGWFYAGNEISAISVILLPFIYLLMKKNKWTFIVVLMISMFIFSRIGTKVILFGTIIVGILVFIETIIEHRDNKISTFLISFLSILIMAATMSMSASVENMNKIIQTPPPTEEIDIIVEEPIETNKTMEILLKLLSGRDIYIIATNNIYLRNLNPNTSLLGLGFSNTSTINNPNVEKLIEIDLLDLFYHTGVIGIGLTLFPFFYCLYTFFKNIKKIKFKNGVIFYGMMILLACGISCISGHVLINPAVSIYLVIYLIYFLNSINFFDKQPLTKNKIQILSLHLGFGGAERATIDLANMLSSKYEVELISLYKTIDKPPYEVNNKIKINYLTNLKPNREEFKEALHNKKLIKTFLEGLKSAYILFIKQKLIKGTVEHTDAEHIISTRMYFTKIAINFGRTEQKTIAIEHNYDIREEYIKEISENMTNINCLVCVSKSATEVYKKKIKNIKIEYLPNIISTEYSNTSNLKNENNIIYAGRLEQEKGVLDLISIVKNIKEERPHIKLNIYGDGSLKKELEKKINENDLKDNIVLHGFAKPQDLEKAYCDSCLFILPSHKESFGIVVLEAMKCGIPTIAFSGATGAKDLIDDGKDGFIIEERDIEKLAAKTIEYLKLDISKKKNIQKNAIKKVGKFTDKIVSKEWFKLIKRL